VLVTKAITEWKLRLTGAVVLAALGWIVGQILFLEEWNPWGSIALTGTGSILGLTATPYMTLKPIRWCWDNLLNQPIEVLLIGLAGLIVGLLIAVLASAALSKLPGLYGAITPLLATILLGSLGVAIAIGRQGEFRSLMKFMVPSSTHPSQSATGNDTGSLTPTSSTTLNGRGTPEILLDTSAIIDGRIADIGETGFLQATVVIPRFVLDELRHIADSSDTLRRNRGRRGLEMLNKLRKDSNVPLNILDVDMPQPAEVDGKLVGLAKRMGVPIVTTDFNLNRIAELQGVKALNINELANSLKPVVVPGEDMLVQVIQEGKESGQGVAYLDDGTMIVVEGGRRYMNQYVDVNITRVLQTAAGRIIFCQPKEEPSRNSR
jgi:uncharacterized protein YacL